MRTTGHKVWRMSAAVSFVGNPAWEQDCSGVRRLLHHLLSGKMSKTYEGTVRRVGDACIRSEGEKESG